MKNIPIASEAAYKEKLVLQTGKLLRRMRLKAYFYEQGIKQNDDIVRDETYGFRSRFTPKASKHLWAFERDLLELVGNIEFRKVNNTFQRELQKDVRRIQNSKNVIVAADKTNNFYEMSKESYQKLLTDNIRANYKKTQSSVVSELNEETKKATEHLAVSDRINQLPLKEAFITLKDHKENFKSAPKCRLINPTKSNVGKVSKVILDRINKTIRLETGLNQWTNTDQVLDWFSNLDESKYQLMKFDVVEFYPSISEDLLKKAIKFAEKHVCLTDDETNIIHNSCKSVLHSKGDVWIKDKGTSTGDLFDVAMGSYSGAETCELIGLFILDGLSKIFGKDLVGIYRDDALAAIPIQSGYKTEKMKASIHRFMKSIGLKVTIEAPLIRTDFLDVELDMQSKTYAPYHKPNSRILYINANSNHPSNITKGVPKIINDRLNKRSSSEVQFNENKKEYEIALKEAGHKAELHFEGKEEDKRRNRPRKIMWFNPPYCMSVKTNIARKFINLVKRHFTGKNPLKRLFNKNNMRVSYCCMDNMETIIKQQNAKILKDKTEEIEESCNCRDKSKCPFKDQEVSCRSKNIIYKAEVKTKTSCKYYIGLSEPEFKKRYNNHTSSFNLERNVKPTLLSEHVKDLKRKGEEFKINWSVLKRAPAAKDGDAVCRLCLKEATAIVFADTNCMNRRNEILNTCRHKRKFLLKFFSKEPG